MVWPRAATTRSVLQSSEWERTNPNEPSAPDISSSPALSKSPKKKARQLVSISLLSAE